MPPRPPTAPGQLSPRRPRGWPAGPSPPPWPVLLLLVSPGPTKNKPRAAGPGLVLWSFASAQCLAGDRPETGPVAVPKPELLAHGCSLAHARGGLHPGPGHAAGAPSQQEPAGHERQPVEHADNDQQEPVPGDQRDGTGGPPDHGP